MYEQEFDVGEGYTPRPSLPIRSAQVMHQVLLRAARALRTGVGAVRTFGPLNVTRAWLASPLYRLRQLLAWTRGRKGLLGAGALGVVSLLLSDPGQRVWKRVKAQVSGAASWVATTVARQLLVHPLPTPVSKVAGWVGQLVSTITTPVRKAFTWLNAAVSRLGVTARRSSTAFAAAALAKLAVPAVPAVVVVTAVLTGLLLLGSLGKAPVGPQDPAPESLGVIGLPDAQVAYRAMEQLAAMLPKVRSAVQDAVSSGDKDGLREARRLLAACRARTGELKAAATALHAGGQPTAELAQVLVEVDALVGGMKVEWDALAQQLRDATGNRPTRRAAASQARRQWTAAPA